MSEQIYPMPPELPPTLRAKFEKAHRAADMLAQIICLASGNENLATGILLELCALHVHTGRNIAHRRIIGKIDGMEDSAFMTILASLPKESDELTPEFVSAMIRMADEREAAEERQKASN